MTNAEIDIKIATDVMGWKRVGENWSTRPLHRPSKDFPGTILNDYSSKGKHDCLISPDGKIKIYFCGCESKDDLPQPSTNIADALEALESLGVAWELYRSDVPDYACNIYSEKDVGFINGGSAKTKEMAICLALLAMKAPA